MTMVPAHLCLDRLIPQSFDPQVDLIPIRVPSAEEPYVSNSISRALSEIKEGGGIEVVGVGSGTACAETMDGGVVGVLHLGKFCGPNASIRPSNGHGDVLVS
jgi:hypothetical protein